ncbi:hypothetical protein D3C81_1933940 [compost metagenome]
MESVVSSAVMCLLTADRTIPSFLAAAEKDFASITVIKMEIAVRFSTLQSSPSIFAADEHVLLAVRG